MTKVYRLTFFLGSVPAATTELFDRGEACPLPFPDPVRLDSGVERWTESLGSTEIQEALRAGLAAYVKNGS